MRRCEGVKEEEREREVRKMMRRYRSVRERDMAREGKTKVKGETRGIK